MADDLPPDGPLKHLPAALISGVVAFITVLVGILAFGNQYVAKETYNTQVSDFRRELDLLRDEQKHRLTIETFEAHKSGTKDYIDAQDQKATQQLTLLNERVNTLYRLYQNLLDAQTKNRP